MKLLVNTSQLVPPLSGIGRYTQQLLAHLILEPEINDLNGFSGLSLQNHYDLETLIMSLDGDRNNRVRSQYSSFRALAKKIPSARLLNYYAQKKLLKSQFEKNSTCIYWEPNYILTPFEGKKITTIYDLSHLRYPEFLPKDRRIWLEKKLPESIDSADAIITISEFSKHEIINEFSVSEDKIFIVPPGVSPVFRYHYSLQQIKQLKQQLALPENYILSVGTIEPRKNIIGLIQAYSALPDRLRNRFPLVLAGAKGWHTEQIEMLLKPLVKKNQLILLGYVEQEKIPILYAAATVLSYISHYEGYGMPIAEAMCSNTAVLTSNVSSMPEVAAQCAQLVDPTNIEQITEHLRELLEDVHKREKLQNQAKKVSDAYRWEYSAKSMLSVLMAL